MRSERSNAGRALAVVALTGLVLLATDPTVVGGANLQRTAPPGPSAPAVRPAPAGSSTLVGSPTLPAAASGGGSAELWASPNDSAITPSSGLEANLTAYTPPVLPTSSSFQVSVAVAIGDQVAVFGFFQNDRFGPVAFYELYNNTTEQLKNLTYWPGLQLLPGTGYLFEIAPVGSGLWALTVNGLPFGGNASLARRPFTDGAIRWSGGIRFSELAQSAGPGFAPPAVLCTLAFAVLTSSGWYLPTRAEAGIYGQLGTAWGIEGIAQHPTLAPGELLSGPGIAAQPNGTVLWSGGPMTAQVTLQANPPTVPSLGGVALNVSVARPGVGSLPGVYVYLADDARGPISPALVATGPDGSARSILQAPNVSVTSTDRIVATVVLFGLSGRATTSIEVEPSVQVRVNAPDRVVAPTSGRITLGVTVTDLGGAPVPGLALGFALAGPGGVDPAAAVTDTSGAASVAVLTGGGTGTLTLIATVTGAGHWGSARVLIDVVVPSPPLGSGWIAVLAALALLGGGGLLAAWGIRRERRRRRPLPPFPRRVANPGAPEGTTPISRRRP